MRDFVVMCVVAIIVLLLAALIVGGIWQWVENHNTPSPVSPSELQVPDDWVCLWGDGFGLTLPDTWEGGSDEGLDELIARLREGDRGDLADYLEENRARLSFYVADAAATGDANITIGKITEYAGVSLDSVYDTWREGVSAEVGALGGTLTIVTPLTTTGPFGNFQRVGRWVARVELGQEVKAMQAVFLIQDGDVFWEVACSTSQENWEEYEPIFEKVVGTMVLIE